ncbi:MAG: hypothetical protein ACFE9I_03425 [Candidatus Hermodarchaeota archaeon]
MAKVKSVAIVLGIFSLIGIIHGVISNSFNIFITWVLIGIWLIYSFKVFKNIKQYREFNSPHNTAFFIISPIFVGIFYSIWSNFTGILGENLLEGSDLYLSWWSILFGFPYVLYGSISLYRCFKKYHVIYFGTKSIKARTFGYILGLSTIIFIIIYWISFYSVVDFSESLLTPLHFLIDLNLLIFLISTILILIVPGLIGGQTRLPQLSRDYISQRTRRLSRLTSPRITSTPRRQRESSRSSSRSSPSPSISTSTRTSRSVTHSVRSTPKANRTTVSSRAKASTRTVHRKNLDLYKPKAASLSPEDFKCIFCFKLPELPKDNGRGIVLCPKCRYPAHADEFKDWLSNSNLCSRCNAPISGGFRRNPRIISVKNYLIIYRDFLRRGR